MRYVYSLLEDSVRKLLLSLSITTPTQLNMFEIARKLNVNLYFFDGKCEANTLGGQRNIFINKNLCIEKQRQSFAHELGHILQHDGYQLRMQHLFVFYQEWKATNFMYHFCIPTFMLEQLVLPSMFNHASWMIAQIFEVEPTFAAHRLKLWLTKKEYILHHTNWEKRKTESKQHA